MEFMHPCLESSAALCNACQLKINRHLAANLKASQALELCSVHANLEPQTGCYHCTSYAQQAFSWSNHPGVREQKHRACYLNRSLAFILFLYCFTFKRACQAEACQANTLIFSPSHCTPEEGSVMCSVGQPLGTWTWALAIWRRLETYFTPSWSTDLMSLVYYKKCHQHSYQP